MTTEEKTRMGQAGAAADVPLEFCGAGPGRAGPGQGRSGRSLLVRLVPWLVLLLMLLFLGFGLVRCTAPEEGRVKVGHIAPQESRMREVSPTSSAAYQERLERYSELKADRALEKDASFVAPAVGVTRQPERMPVTAPVPRPLPERPAAAKAPEERPAPATVQARPAAQGSGRAAGRDSNARAAQQARADARLVSWMAALDRQLVPAQGTSLVLNSPSPELPAAAGGRKGGAGDGGAGQPPTGLPGMRAGDILYAINRVTLDSDAPGPAMAEVLIGDWQGARVLGAFQRLGEHLVLKFNELVTPGGTVYPIQGYAIDPKTDRTAVRSSVDNHYLARWGGLVAASFLDGFGEAVSRSGTRSYSSIYGTDWTTPDYNVQQELWIAAGKVGEKTGAIMERNFSRPPTVVLSSGTEMGILLLRLPSVRTGSGRDAGRTPVLTEKDSARAAGQGDTAAEIRAEQGEVRRREAARTAPVNTRTVPDTARYGQPVY